MAGSSTQTIVLPAASATLRLITDENKWCRVELVLDGRVETLGAETRDRVVSRLRAGLADALEMPFAGELGGAPSEWILSLMEHHHTIYANDIDGCRTWHIQDRDAHWIARITFTADERRRWRELLAP